MSGKHTSHGGGIPPVLLQSAQAVRRSEARGRLCQAASLRLTGMPELPEVETIRRGIAPHLCGRTIVQILVRERALRWPVWGGLGRRLQGETIRAVERRAKYLLLAIGEGHLMIHLGMSGSLRIVNTDRQAGPHDHFDAVLSGGRTLRLNDPRRFGSLHWFSHPPQQHPLLQALGPEPLEEDFDGAWLHRRARGRRLAVKSLIMDGRVVAGIGNIYANEALFTAGIAPHTEARRLSLKRCRRLARAIRTILRQAIALGGATLRNFSDEHGRPGYFQTTLRVYGRAGAPCPRRRCPGRIQRRLVGNRASFFCYRCQR